MCEENKKYKPGFFCSLFWVFTWLGMLGGVAALLFVFENSWCIMIGGWIFAGVSAIISYIIRTVEKSRFDGKWSWHWFD